MAKRSTGLNESKQAVRERELKAVELRNSSQGMSYDEIAERVGYADGESARKAILRAMERHVIANVEELRTEELSRLDTLWNAIYDKAKAGDEKAIETALKILAQRRKYIGGLEAPQQVDVKVENVGPEDFEALMQQYADGYNAGRQHSESKTPQ